LELLKENGQLKIKKSMVAYVCKHIWEEHALALLVIHDEDGYQILCKGFHSGTSPHVMPLEDFIKIHPDLKGIKSLKENHLAERINIDDPWII